MVVLVNRAKMSTSTTGTGTISLGSALAGFQSFANAGVSNGDTVRYVIEEGTNFEIGSGTYTSSGTTLSRNPSESSNSGNAITLGGSAEVFITASAADIFVNDGANSLTTTGVITGGTVEATSDTAAGDNAAIGYTAAEGLILTGQGSTSDITFKNDADAAVFNIPTGTTTLNVTGTVQADQFNNDEALPDIRPSLLLDFANSKTLDPRITFARGSTATYWDGVTTTKAEENLIQYSQELDNAAWGKSGVTVTANNTAAPDGTTTAEKVAISTEGNYRNVAQFNSGLASAAYTASAYVKRSNHDYLAFELQSRANDNSFINTISSRRINLTNGATVGSDVGTCTTTDVGNGWYRITVSGTSASNAQKIYIDFGCADSTGNTAPSTNIANGQAFFIWGAQLEQRSAATAYTATTSAPVVKYQPTLQTAASGAARFDHDPVTSESKGLLIEEARTNLLPYSADFSNSAWVKNNAAVYSNQVIAPDGTQTADNVVGTTVSGEHYVQDDLTAATGTFTDSVFVKANGVTSFFIRPVHVGADEGPTQQATFNLSNGTIGSLPSNTTATITDVGNDWYRCTFTFTITGTLSGSYGVRLQLSVTGDGYKGVYLWGAQREAFSFPTSYIPTSGSTVTRAADAAQVQNFDFNDGEGTVYCEGSIKFSTSVQSYARLWEITQDADANSRFNVFMNESGSDLNMGFVTQGTVYGGPTLDGSYTSGANVKTVVGYKLGENADAAEGGTLSQGSALWNTTGTSRNRLYLGSASGTSAWSNSYVRKFAYYSKLLSDATLQAMTTE